LAAPQPFRWFEEKGELLGYAQDAAALEDAHALPAADGSGQAAREALSLDTLDLRTMPASWRAGAKYAFEVRVRPVRRIGRGKRGDGPGEHDAFGLAVRGKPREAWPARADVYLDWTAERLRRGGAAPLDCMRLLSLKRTEIIRRRHDDEGRLVRFDGPDAVVTGTFQVIDAESFAGLLARGVGRHVAFGFGMLLLGPVRMR
jgi:CRISPR system Cascade subunit CasE